MYLNYFNTIINDVSKYLATTFNINTNMCVCVSRAHSCLISAFLNKLQIIIQHSLEHCLIIIMGDFHVNILKDNNHGKNKQE